MLYHSIRNGEHLDRRNEQGYTPLMEAILANQTDAVALLLKEGADYKLKSPCGRKPCQLAKTVPVVIQIARHKHEVLLKSKTF